MRLHTLICDSFFGALLGCCVFRRFLYWAVLLDRNNLLENSRLCGLVPLLLLFCLATLTNDALIVKCILRRAGWRQHSHVLDRRLSNVALHECLSYKIAALSFNVFRRVRWPNLCLLKLKSRTAPLCRQILCLLCLGKESPSEVTSVFASLWGVKLFDTPKSSRNSDDLSWAD